MAYTAVSDFRFGMDRRRPQASGVPGTLWRLKNAVISRGGDIERAKKFALTETLPSGTFGLFAVRGQRYVFGSATTPGGMPVGVRYQQLAAPSTPTMTKVLDAKGFAGKVYAVAAYDDGSVYHFHDGARVSSLDTPVDAAASYETVAQRLADLIDAQAAYSAKAFGAVVEITAAVAGTGFTISAAAVDVDVDASAPTAVAASIQANVAAVAEVRATGTVTITGGTQSFGVNRVTAVTVDGVDLLENPIDWIDSNASTAAAVSAEINNNTTTHGYAASALGAAITLRAAPGTGATPNGDVVAVSVAGDATASTANIASGVTAVTAVAQVSKVTIGAGTLDATDRWTITLNSVDYKTTGRASATPTSVLVNQSRVFGVGGSFIRYSKINDATDWTDATASSGAGFINVSNEVDGVANLVGMAKYNDLIAVFSRDVIVTYSLPADAEQFTRVQVLDNTGTLAPRSLVSYGANDVYYLDETGVRSLRTRDSFDSAYASDVGSAIDPFVQELVAEVGAGAVADACAVIEPIDGRYMLALGRYVLVLSYFPSSKITAWSYLDFEATVTDLIRVGRAIYLRSGNGIYAYGGAAGTTYPDADEFEVDVETPFISSKDPAGLKELQGFDVAAQGTWRVQVLPNPNTPTAAIDGGWIDGVTYHRADYKIPGRTSHFAQKFTCSAAGYASLSSTAIHHNTVSKS